MMVDNFQAAGLGFKKKILPVTSIIGSQHLPELLVNFTGIRRCRGWSSLTSQAAYC